MLAVRSEKRRIFEQEVLPELDVLFAAALYLASSQEEANDLCEKTVVRAYRSFNSRLRSDASRRAWLLAILLEVVRSESSRAHSDADASTVSEAGAAEISTLSVSDARLASRSANDAGFDQALQSLPEDFRAALVMVDVAELTYRETASVLAVPVETVRQRIAKGRALMRSALGIMGGPGGLARA